MGEIPGRRGMYIMAGYTGHGMPQIFLVAKGLANMVANGSSFADTGIPRVFKETSERLESDENFVMDMYMRSGVMNKL